MTIDDLLRYLKRDLLYLEGVADGTDCKGLKLKVQAMRTTVKNFEHSQGRAPMLESAAVADLPVGNGCSICNNPNCDNPGGKH